MAGAATARIEAFSDGVFAMAIALLVLGLKVPRNAYNDSELATDLAREWPGYLAIATSFLTILIAWISHHRMFNLISRSDDRLLFWNGMLLFGVSAVPFSTSLIATYLVRGGQRTAAVVYSATFMLIAVVFNLLWRSAAVGDRLIDPNADRSAVRAMFGASRFRPVWYVLAGGLALVNGTASLVVNLALALYLAKPYRRARAESDIY